MFWFAAYRGDPRYTVQAEPRLINKGYGEDRAHIVSIACRAYDICCREPNLVSLQSVIAERGFAFNEGGQGWGFSHRLKLSLEGLGGLG